MERLGEVSKQLDGDFNSSSGRMFMSTEKGSFDNRLSGLLVTKYDAELDRNSVNSANQMFEKRVSGIFLGELLRLAGLGHHRISEDTLWRPEKSSMRQK